MKAVLYIRCFLSMLGSFSFLDDVSGRCGSFLHRNIKLICSIYKWEISRSILKVRIKLEHGNLNFLRHRWSFSSARVCPRWTWARWHDNVWPCLSRIGGVIETFSLVPLSSHRYFYPICDMIISVESGNHVSADICEILTMPTEVQIVYFLLLMMMMVTVSLGGLRRISCVVSLSGQPGATPNDL